jgi:predicted  nucleic acid-binding Zn-ribbon protein
MAAPAGVSDQKLEDRIYDLHRRSVDPAMRQILEEAMQLCSAGHHMEAAALVEKAEAISALVSQNGGVSGEPRRENAPETPGAELPLAARIAADIANGLTNVLVRAIQDLERHISTENDRLGSTFGQRLDRLQNSVEGFQVLHDRLDHLVQAGAAVEEKCDQLAATTTSLREAHARLDTDMAEVRSQMDYVSASTSSRVDEACRRIEGQEREICTLNSGISELASRVTAAAERLERHANAIRTIHDSHQERTAVLGQVGELLERFKSAPESPETLAL